MKRDHSLIRLRPYGTDDLALLRQLLGDEEMTRFLGGPESDEAIEARHARYLEADPETNGLFVILPGEEGGPAGWVGFCESAWAGEPGWEIGWHVLPALQGHGVATAAARIALEAARSKNRHDHVDAFPSADNAASNAVCRRLGFTSRGEAEVEYPKGRLMRSVHWRLSFGHGKEPRMNDYTDEEVAEALRPIASLSSKSEKAQTKVAPETWQYAMLERNLAALRIAYALMSEGPEAAREVSRADLSSALDAFASMIDRTEKAQAKFSPGTSQHSLARNRLKALSIGSALIRRELEKR